MEILGNIFSKNKKILFSKIFFIREGKFPEGKFPEPKKSIIQLFKEGKRVYTLKRVSDDYFTITKNESYRIQKKEDFCKICFERGNSLIFEKCHHTGFCLTCVKKMKINAINSKRKVQCPYCSRDVETVLEFEKYGDDYVIKKCFDEEFLLDCEEP